MKIDRTNKPWNNTITDEDILNKEYSLGYLIQSNQHLQLFQELKDIVLSKYKVIAKFRYLGYNGEKLICNNQTLVYRPNKNSNYILGKDVKEISSNLSHNGGGSNKYPSIGYIGAEVILNFISYGLPQIDELNGWSCEIIELTKIP